jgi:hypothetical protein
MRSIRIGLSFSLKYTSPKICPVIFFLNTTNIAGMNIFLEHNAIILDIEVGIVDPIDIYIALHSYIKNPKISL